MSTESFSYVNTCFLSLWRSFLGVFLGRACCLGDEHANFLFSIHNSNQSKNYFIPLHVPDLGSCLLSRPQT